MIEFRKHVNGIWYVIRNGEELGELMVGHFSKHYFFLPGPHRGYTSATLESIVAKMKELNVEE